MKSIRVSKYQEYQEYQSIRVSRVSRGGWGGGGVVVLSLEVHLVPPEGDRVVHEHGDSERPYSSRDRSAKCTCLLDLNSDIPSQLVV